MNRRVTDLKSFANLPFPVQMTRSVSLTPKLKSTGF